MMYPASCSQRNKLLYWARNLTYQYLVTRIYCCWIGFADVQKGKHFLQKENVKLRNKMQSSVLFLKHLQNVDMLSCLAIPGDTNLNCTVPFLENNWQIEFSDKFNEDIF
jgi:hypothetical protein